MSILACCLIVFWPFQIQIYLLNKYEINGGPSCTIRIPKDTLEDLLGSVWLNLHLNFSKWIPWYHHPNTTVLAVNMQKILLMTDLDMWYMQIHQPLVQLQNGLINYHKKLAEHVQTVEQ